MIPEQNRNSFPVEIKELKEIDDQVMLIVKYDEYEFGSVLER